MSDDDYEPPSAPGGVSLSPGTSWGLAALLIGCTLLISACALMVFNVILFRGGLGGIPRDLARLGGTIGVIGVAVMGLLSIVFGVRGWGGGAARRVGGLRGRGHAGGGRGVRRVGDRGYRPARDPGRVPVNGRILIRPKYFPIPPPGSAVGIVTPYSPRRRLVPRS